MLCFDNAADRGSSSAEDGRAASDFGAELQRCAMHLSSLQLRPLAACVWARYSLWEPRGPSCLVKKNDELDRASRNREGPRPMMLK